MKDSVLVTVMDLVGDRRIVTVCDSVAVTTPEGDLLLGEPDTSVETVPVRVGSPDGVLDIVVVKDSVYVSVFEGDLISLIDAVGFDLDGVLVGVFVRVIVEDTSIDSVPVSVGVGVMRGVMVSDTSVLGVTLFEPEPDRERVTVDDRLFVDVGSSESEGLGENENEVSSVIDVVLVMAFDGVLGRERDREGVAVSVPEYDLASVVDPVCERSRVDEVVGVPLVDEGDMEFDSDLDDSAVVDGDELKDTSRVPLDDFEVLNESDRLIDGDNEGLGERESGVTVPSEERLTLLDGVGESERDFERESSSVADPLDSLSE